MPAWSIPLLLTLAWVKAGCGLMGSMGKSLSGASQEPRGEVPAHSISSYLKAQCGSGDQRELALGGPVFRRCCEPPGSSQLNLPSQRQVSCSSAPEMGETYTHLQRGEELPKVLRAPSLLESILFQKHLSLEEHRIPQAHGLFLCKGLFSQSKPRKEGALARL